MLGVLCWAADGVRLERVEVLGLPVLKVSLPAGGVWAKRRMKKAARLLVRHGVRKILPTKGFDSWEVPVRCGLRPVDPLPLYRSMGAELALAALVVRGVDPSRAVVALAGEYADGDLVRTAQRLCPRVRMVVPVLEQGGEQLARDLYLRFGAAVDLETQSDLCVRFCGARKAGELVLCAEPDLIGLRLDASVPETELEKLPLLTALWQAGRLKQEEIRVVLDV